ncbi:MAG: flavodoxin-dependent (E)-4-hydroxy-3-methylbut-2-enyl-diphosphate synthase [Proteobacteria bacterium]|nr:flavodoxin-dependent (E)-4-hydroxy-3-methylbut-2-enyl-diphosphate synthase [Pseudomonadota bacterium]
MRRKTRRISIGRVAVGDGAPVSVQSMTNTDTSDAEATLRQIERLADAGCEIVRLAVPDDAAAAALSEIRRRTDVPLVADIHFRHDLALAAVKAGVDGLRINPGNIGSPDRVAEVAAAAKARGIPIRVGVNAGSLEKDILARHAHPTPAALVESALRHVALLERVDFRDIKISVKASSVADTVSAYRMLSGKVDCPLHLGVTEAGTLLAGAIKSAMGIGTLLAEGLGDTIRVSLTADPVKEVRAGYEILANLGLRDRPYPEVISCPTCGRARIDVERLAEEVEGRLAGVRAPIRVAVMGCAVNGPGEAKEADVGVAGGDGKGVIIRGGKIIRTCPEGDLADELMKEIESLINRG